MSFTVIITEYQEAIMRTSRLSVAIFFIAALSNQLDAYAGSANENGDKGTKTEPVTEPDPDCDHNDVLPSHRLFRLTF
jgi:hypothetical protein